MSNFKVNITGIDTNKLKVLKSDETIELLKRLRAGENVKDEIVMGNLKLVLSAVKPYRSQKYSLDDLFQIGVIGLIKSIDNFDVSKNVMFSTYAVPMIRGEIKRYVRDSVSILRVSRQVKDLAYHCFKAKEELTQQLERSPTYEEISKYLNIKKEQVKEAFESFNPVMSFSEPINNTDEDSLELYDIKDEKIEIIRDYTKCINENKPPIVMFPFIFQDVIKICDTILDGNSVIINLMYLEKAEKLRVLDFVCGLAYSLKLKKEKIESGVYLFEHIKRS